MAETTLVTMDDVRKAVGFKVTRKELPNARGVDTGFDAIFRNDNGANLGVVSREYQMVEHQQALENVLNVFEKKKLPKVTPTDIQITDGGSKMFASFVLNKKSDIGVATKGNRNVGDIISPGFKIVNSYDRTIRLSLLSYVIRLICTNGVTANEELFTEKRRHTKNLDLDYMIEQFMNSFERFDDVVVPRIAEMAQAKVNPVILEKELNLIPGWIQDESLTYLEEGGWIKFSEKEGESEIEMVKAMTRWDLLNSFTYVTTHSQTNPQRALEATREISERFWDAKAA